MITMEETSPGKRKNGSHLSTDLKLAIEPQQQNMSKDHTIKAQTSSSTTCTTDNAEPKKSVPNNSQQNSPTKNKSNKNKKRSDAKKHKANLKKQQTAALGDTLASSVAVCELPSSSDSNTQLLNERSTRSSDSNSNTTNKTSSNNTESLGQMDIKSDHIPKRNEHSVKESKTNQKDDIILSHETVELDAKAAFDVTSNFKDNPSSKTIIDKDLWDAKQSELSELIRRLKLRDSQLLSLNEKFKQQIVRIKELESSLKRELDNKLRLEKEASNLDQTSTKLKHQISLLEKDRVAQDELMRTLNATLIERDTEVSILKLKMTRLQTAQSKVSNTLPPVSSLDDTSGSVPKRDDPMKFFTASGRSNSEFSRSSYARSSMIAEVAANSRSSTSQLQHMNTNDRDAHVWAKVPEELTPSKKPLLLERNHPRSSMYSDQYTLIDPLSPLRSQQHSKTNFSRDVRMYKTMPKSMKGFVSPIFDQQSPVKETNSNENGSAESQSSTNQKLQVSTNCLVTNLDENNGTCTKTTELSSQAIIESDSKDVTRSEQKDSSETCDRSFFEAFRKSDADATGSLAQRADATTKPSMIERSPPKAGPSTPVKITSGLKKIFNVFRRSDSSTESGTQSKSDIRATPLEAAVTPNSEPFQRGGARSTLVGLPGMARGIRRSFQTDKPFSEWDTDMIVDWLTTIGLSMYAAQCRRWVKCGAHIMNATPVEVDKGLGITNHLHRKKLRLAISELNGDCDKVTKAAAKLDYLWVARWLDDIGLPQYKEAFINARVDGRVLNYLTVEDLFSMNVRSMLHHSSIKCGIKVLRSINFDLQLLKRRASADEVERMSSIRQQMNSVPTNTDQVNQSGQTDMVDVPLWTCHRVMEWLRMINFAEFAPNLRGSGVHGGLIIYEDGFTIDSISSLLGISNGQTLLRRHLETVFDDLIGQDLVRQKRQFKSVSSNEPLDPKMILKSPKRSSSWFGKLKSPKVGQDGTDEYLCPMYPPSIIKSPVKRKSEVLSSQREGCPQLPRIPESINV